ncbi:MAG: hypothetical protein ACYC4R_14425 [Anaerolineae bacterium]
MNLGDVDLGSGSVAVRRGKGGKARKALAGYLRYRRGAGLAEPLWATTQGGLREIVRRRAREAGVRASGLRALRRAFALKRPARWHRRGEPAAAMGHTTLDLLRRYLAQNAADLQAAHAGASPVDRLL